MRRLAIAAAVGAAFLAGRGLAGGHDALLKELRERQKMLFSDLDKIDKAAKDVVEIREMRESGKYVLNSEERKMEKQGRSDFHIFMERYRNDTLETLRIFDRVLQKEDYVDPLQRTFGKALEEIVTVNWDERELEDVIADLEAGYGVKLNVSGDIEYRKTLSLRGEMSLLSILLYIENVFDAKLVLKEGSLWFVRVANPTPSEDEEEEPPPSAGG